MTPETPYDFEMTDAALTFGSSQLRVMRALWSLGEATAREITDACAEDPAMAHSTVQTLLRMLEAKGAVDHRQDGRTFIFFATVSSDRATNDATRRVVDRMFGGQATKMIAHLLRQEDIDPDELDQIRKLVDDAQSGSDAKTKRTKPND